MDETLWTLVDIVGPLILLVVLVWVVMRTRRRSGQPPNDVTEEGARDAYREEEQMRREGTDDR
jgi:hypothetical protein